MAQGTPSYSKVDIVHRLAERFGYRRYLEFATGTTGHFYRLIDRGRFDECRRLLYNAPPDFADGLAVDYRSADFGISAPLAAIARERRRFDVILVDPYHGYRESRRDLEAALELLTPGGALVVHDCLPPSAELARPDFQKGDWCGVTYKAYLDFVIAHPELRYVTVDTDYGCGIVRKSAPSVMSRLRRSLRWRQFARWRGFGNDYAAAWRYFATHQKTLLDLIDVDAFLAGRDGLG
jgi:SAM-dependent methyltransferase